ncbi:hypothetical protein FNAPI_5536 [Fusarium napiforme]|uniref:Uncharacterized protein n=1 Tax=Fusarium napiforme TaxID=42672 RepID=A0A8H5JKJ7_9HYPO|nr:hypothetical protein FNAPI_5536 [Fusarium napiforme]
MLDRVTVASGSTAASYREWSKLIAQIDPKHHRFTRETDLLPSIAGIASLFSKRWNDDYAAGLWKGSMHQSLCWAVAQAGKPTYKELLKRLKTPSPYIAPSWSWASRREAFSFKPHHSSLFADCRPEFHSLDTSITLLGESAFGEVRDASLDITSKVFVGSPRINIPFRYPGYDLVCLDGQYFANIEPDCIDQHIFAPYDGKFAMPISFLLIGSTIRRGTYKTSFPAAYHKSEVLGDVANVGLDSKSSRPSPVSAESGGDLKTKTVFESVAYGLLILPTGNMNEYYRVGTFFSKPEYAGGLSLFDNVEVRTVRLV